MPDFESILKRLIESRVQFVIIGGYAAVAHGAPLLTQAVDICARFSAGNLLRLQKALAGLHPVHRMTPDRRPLQLTADSRRGLKNLYLSTEWGVLDCLGSVAGLGDYAAVLKNSLKVDLGFGTCRILSLAALIKSKKAMDRPRDREALLLLKAIREAQARRVSRPARQSIHGRG